MGAAQSTSGAPSEQVIRPQEGGTSVQFAPSLINQLANPSASSSSDSSSRTHHDQAIMSRLQAETARLRHQEQEILSSISAALEKENLDKEKPGMSSEVLSHDIEEIKAKVERMTEKRSKVLGDSEGVVKKGRDAVVKCYLNNPDKPLDCWKEVEAFKSSVGKLEQEFVQSLR